MRLTKCETSKLIFPKHAKRFRDIFTAEVLAKRTGEVTVSSDRDQGSDSR